MGARLTSARRGPRRGCWELWEGDAQPCGVGPGPGGLHPGRS